MTAGGAGIPACMFRFIPTLLLCASAALSQEKQPEFQVKPGEFPPEGTAHYFGGELTFQDHVNRTGQIRPDRRNDQRTDDYDRPMNFTLLPYGTVRYHGAPAEMRDIPIGTHLHGQFYFDPKGGKTGKGAFTQVLLFEDDFSFQQRQKRLWRVDAIDQAKGTMTVTGQSQTDKKTDEKPTVYKINPATRIWKGRGIGALADLAPGQLVLINITVATLKGPGRCVEVWLDDESRQVAAEHQTEVHRAYEKAHGLPGWIDAVDNEKRLVTVTLFGGFDPALGNDFKVKTRIATLVAEDSLRCYDQINDRMYSEIQEIKSIPVVSGSSGIQIIIKPENLLEGFRPHRILRLLAEKWALDDLPWEEMLWPSDNRAK